MGDFVTPHVPSPFSSDALDSEEIHAAAREVDADFFEFMEELSVMDIDVPDFSVHHSSGESASKPTVDAPVVVSPGANKQRKASAEERIQRIREKNRVAQARFRQKQKARTQMPC